MNKTALKTYKPPKTLVDFAKKFSDSFRGLSAPQTLTSKYGRYEIRLTEYIHNDISGEVLNDIGRIRRSDGVIQFSKKKLLWINAKPDFIFFMILFLVRQTENNGDTKLSDVQVLNYCISKARCLENDFLQNFLGMVEGHETPQSVERFKLIKQFIRERPKSITEKTPTT